MWVFDRIPEDLHGEVIKLFRERDLAGLATIFNTYRIAGARLRPCCSAEQILIRTRSAIAAGKIKQDGSDRTP